MKDGVYTLLDLAEQFGKDKQFIRRRIVKLNLRAINKDKIGRASCRERV